MPLATDDIQCFREGVLDYLDEWKVIVAQAGISTCIQELVDSLLPLAEKLASEFPDNKSFVNSAAHMRRLRDNQEEAAQILTELLNAN